jgi:hypothetical protein
VPGSRDRSTSWAAFIVAWETNITCFQCAMPTDFSFFIFLLFRGPYEYRDNKGKHVSRRETRLS